MWLHDPSCILFPEAGRRWGAPRTAPAGAGCPVRPPCGPIPPLPGPVRLDKHVKVRSGSNPRKKRKRASRPNRFCPRPMAHHPFCSLRTWNHRNHLPNRQQSFSNPSPSPPFSLRTPEAHCWAFHTRPLLSGGFGMTPWCDDLVCSWRRLLADRQSLPFPWTLPLHRLHLLSGGGGWGGSH